MTRVKISGIRNLAAALPAGGGGLWGRASAGANSDRYRDGCAKWKALTSSNPTKRSAATTSSHAAKRSWSSERVCLAIAW